MLYFRDQTGVIIGDREVRSSRVCRKVVKQTRNTVFMADENGDILQYQLVKPKPNTKPKKVPKRKESRQAIDELVSTMPKCSVVLKSLSQADIDAIVAKIEREGQIRTIEEKMKNLARKNVSRNIWDFFTYNLFSWQ